jgi:hypothetical protein
MICNIAMQTPSPPHGATPFGLHELDLVLDSPRSRDAERAAEYVKALVESSKPVPRARHASEMPSTLKIGRAMICVWLGGAKRAP